jgi:hypothetical protein
LKITNDDVPHQLGLRKELMKDIIKTKTAYFSQFITSTSTLKEILEGKEKGTRARGRPAHK